MHRLLVLLVTLTLLTPLAAPASANDVQDRHDATARAKEIFRLADNGDFNAMYDLIHPDARAVIPRNVAVNTFEQLYGQGKVGRGVVTGVEMTTWTWGVTGQTYSNAAAVSFEQSYVENGEDKYLEDTMYLVQGPEKDWRWFFGGTRAFVDQMIAAYGDKTAEDTGNPVVTTPLTEGNLIDNVINDLDSFYRGAFKYTDLTYKSPGVVLVENGDSEMTACGPAATGFWAFYCPGDEIVYLDDAFLSELGKKAPFAEAFVIAHEWAHHIQTGVGLRRVSGGEQPSEWNDVYSIELELMADCMSGAWAQDVASRNMLNPDDIQQTVEFTIQYLGDPAYIDNYDDQAHGSAEMRAEAIMSGYNDGFLACDITV